MSNVGEEESCIPAALPCWVGVCVGLVVVGAMGACLGAVGALVCFVFSH